MRKPQTEGDSLFKPIDSIFSEDKNVLFSLSSLTAKKASQKVPTIYLRSYSGTELRTLFHKEHTQLTIVLNSEHFLSGFPLGDLLIKFKFKSGHTDQTFQ